MVAQLLLLITDADAVPGFGLSCYCLAVADVATTMADFSAATTLIADVIGFGSSCYSSAAVATMAVADANQ